MGLQKYEFQIKGLTFRIFVVGDSIMTAYVLQLKMCVKQLVSILALEPIYLSMGDNDWVQTHINACDW